MSKSGFARRMSRTLLWMIGASVLITAYQNCSGGFTPMPLASITPEEIGTVAPIVYDSPTLTAVNPPATLSNGRDQTLKFSVGLDSRLSLKSATCSLDSGAPQECSNLSFEMLQLMDGDHVVVVTAEDSNGQKTPELRLLFRVDATLPVVTFSQVPPAITGASATIAFAASDALSGVSAVECSLDGAAFAACTSPRALTALAMGPHTFKVRAKDNAGNSSLEAGATWTVDLTAPALVLSVKPTAVTNSKAASFEFTGTIGMTPVSAFQCSLDNVAFATCMSPANYANLADGLHSFRVQGRDNTGAYSSPLGYSWRIDTVVPTMPVLMANVGANTKLTSASVSFSSTDAASGVASFQCSVDNAAFAVCTSPRAVSSLAEGLHSIRVKAIDGATNESAISTLGWRVDLTLPVVALTAKPPALTTDTSTSFTFTVTDAGSGLASTECQLDTQAYAACTSPKSFASLPAGLHAFRVRATDLAGNVQTLEDAWTIEGVAPPPTALDGRMLYTNNCSSCHGAIDTSVKRGKTASQIQDAINTVGAMSALRSLSAAEVGAIAGALAVPTNVTVTAEMAASKYFAQSATSKDAKRTFRLTRDQLEKTVASLFTSTSTLPSIKTALPADPLVGNYEYAENLNFNSSNFPGFKTWIEGVVAAVTANPKIAIDCTSSNNSTTCLSAQAKIFLTKAFRGDVTAAKVTELVNFYLNQVTLNGVASATASFVDVTLSSPQFLFREEFETTSVAELVATEQLQMLTYVLADIPPEKLNLSSGSATNYLQPTTKVNLVNSILASSDARAKLGRFLLAWVEVKDPGQYSISQSVFPEFTPQVAQSAVDETKKFVALHMTKPTPSLKDVTRATQSYVDSNLASIYGVTTPDPLGNTLVTLNPAERLGIFSQASVIASHSGPDVSRLVKRGAFFARKVMCIPIAGTPPGVNTTLPAGNTQTQRQKVETATNSSSCLGCHSVMNPLGFFQENFSASGKWRTLDAGLPINASITFSNLDEGSFNANGPVETLTELTDSVMFKQCFIRQMFRYYVGRNETPSDDPVLKEMFLAFMQNDKQDILAALKVLANSNRLIQR